MRMLCIVFNTVGFSALGFQRPIKSTTRSPQEKSHIKSYFTPVRKEMCLNHKYKKAGHSSQLKQSSHQLRRKTPYCSSEHNTVTNNGKQIKSAMFTFSPVGSLSSNGLRMRVCVYLCVNIGITWNELICGYANIVHTSGSFRPHTHTHTRTHARTHARTHSHII